MSKTSKRGRPPVEVKRDKCYHLRLHPTEYEMIKKEANRRGMTMADFIRQAIINEIYNITEVW